jgi:serine/threonine protein kinase/WD40 repeat protein
VFISESDPVKNPVLSQALSELERDLLDGGNARSEDILERFPSLCNDEDSVMELLYTEFTIKTELNPESESELVSQFFARFPHMQGKLERLFQVGRILVPLLEQGAIPSKPRSHSRRHKELQSSNESPQQMGDYEIVETIGRGGMGIVYKAIQKSLDRIVAIKTVDGLRFGDKVTVAELVKEAEIASQLQHPNIVQIFEVGMHDEMPYFSMEHVSGGTLADAIRHYPLTPTVAAKLIAIIARAIGYAHERKILHRDLKPSNILLAPSDRPEALGLHSQLSIEAKPNSRGQASSVARGFEPKVTDFGLAAGLGDVEEHDKILGTPCYMAPEQIDSKFGAICVQSDVYALGSILYHCLSGKPPFQAPTVKETLDQVLQDDAQPLSTISRRIPRDLEVICNKCLQKKPDNRYPTAIELANDLQRFLTHNPIQAKAPSIAEHSIKWSRRHPTAVSVIALCMITSFVAILFWLSASRRAQLETVARQHAERVLYGSQIALAAIELSSHDVMRCRKILEECDPRFRDWEWKYLNESASDAYWESAPASMPVNAAAISPDGKKVAWEVGLWGKDNPQSIQVWDVDTNKHVFTLEGHPNCQITAVQFSPDGSRLLSAAVVSESKKFGGVIEWDLESGLMKREIASVNARVASYSPDGSKIVIGTTKGEVLILDAAAGEVIKKHKEHQSIVQGIAFGSHNRFITSSHDGIVCLWHLDKGLLCQLNDIGDARQVVWFPKSESVWIQLFSGTVLEFEIRQEKLSFLNEQKVRYFSFIAPSPDSLIYAQAGYGEGVEVRLLHNHQIIKELNGHRGNVRTISISKNAQRVLTGGADGALRVWNLKKQTAPLSKLLSGGGAVADFAFHPTKREIAMAIRKSDARSAVFTGDPRIEIRNLDTMELVQSVYCHSDWLTKIVYSRDGKRLASGSLDKTVCLWDPNTLEKIYQWDAHSDPISALDFLDDKTLVSVDNGGNLCVWNCETGTQISSFTINKTEPEETPTKTSKNGICLARALSNRNHILVTTSSPAPKLQIWDWTLERVIQDWSLDFEPRTLAYSPSNELVAVAGLDGKCVVYDLFEVKSKRSFEPLSISIGNASNVTCVTFSPNGQRLCSAGEDDTLRLFDSKVGTELLNFNGPYGRFGLIQFTPDGGSIFRFVGRNYSTWSIKSREMEQDDSWALGMANLALQSGNHKAVLFYCQKSIETGYELLKARELILRSALQQPKLSPEEVHLAFANLIENHAESTSPLVVRYYLRNNRRDDAVSQLNKMRTISSPIADPNFANWNAWYAALIGADQDLLQHWRLQLRELHRQRKQPYYANTLALVEYRLGNFDDAIKFARESQNLDRNLSAPLDWLMELAALVQKSRQIEIASPKKKLASITKEANSSLSQIERWVNAQASRRAAGLDDTIERHELYSLEIPLLLKELNDQLKEPTPLEELPWNILDQFKVQLLTNDETLP